MPGDSSGTRLPRDGIDHIQWSVPTSKSERVFESQERVSGFPEKGADLRGSLGNFRGTSGMLFSSTVKELPGKSPKSFRGSSGNFRGSPGTSQKLGGA